ncbi:hypothetical protein D3C87_1614080 [compost metagenome]
MQHVERARERKSDGRPKRHHRQAVEEQADRPVDKGPGQPEQQLLQLRFIAGEDDLHHRMAETGKGHAHKHDLERRQVAGSRRHAKDNDAGDQRTQRRRQ